MAKRRSTKVYSDSDVSVMLKLPKELHGILKNDARLKFRSIPMQIASIITKYYADYKTEQQDISRNKNVLYTEKELKDMQINYEERSKNGRV